MEMDEARKERRLKRGNRALRFRGLKNFLFWLTGVISGFIIIIGLIFMAVYVVPTKTILGFGGINNTDEYVSDEIASKSIIKALTGIKDYSVGDIPFLEKTLKDIASSSGIDEYVTIDYDKLSEVKFSYDDGRNFATELQACMKVTATIESIGGKEMLGDMANLSVFSWEEAEADPLAENFEPKLYYYMVSGDSVENGVFERAFTDDGAYVEGVNESTETYLASLDKLPLTEVKDILSARFGMLKVSSLINSFGGEGDGQTIENIFKDTTINGLNSFTFDNVKLTDVVAETEENSKMFSFLRSAAGVPEGTELTIAHLDALNVDNAYLDDVLDETGNEKLFKILKSAAGLEETDSITLGHLKTLDFNNIHLNDVLESGAENAKLYAILTDVTGKIESEITVGDLSNFDTDNIHLAKIIEPETNEKLYNLLLDASGVASADLITVGSLSGDAFNIDNIRLSTVIDRNSGSVQNNDILKSLLFNPDGSENDAVTLGNVAETINNKKLSEIYDVTCFEKASAGSGKATYDMNVVDGKEVYTLNSAGEGEYCVSESAGVWLFMLYDADKNTDSAGNAMSYTESGTTLSGMNERVSGVHNSVVSATIRQLVDAGILEDNAAYQNKYALSVLTILQTAVIVSGS